MKIKGTKNQALKLSKKLGKPVHKIRKPNPAMVDMDDPKRHPRPECWAVLD